MDNKWTLLWIILDRSHALIILNFEKDLSDVTEVALAVTIILMTVMQFLIKMRFSRDNHFITLTTFF